MVGTATDVTAGLGCGQRQGDARLRPANGDLIGHLPKKILKRLHRLIGAAADLAAGMGRRECQRPGRLGAAGGEFVGHPLDRGVERLRRALAAAAEFAANTLGGGLEPADHVVRAGLHGGGGLVGGPAQRLGSLGEARGDRGGLCLRGAGGFLCGVQHPRGGFGGALGEQAAHGLDGLAQAALQGLDAGADALGRGLGVAADAVMGGSGPSVEVVAQPGHGLAQALGGAGSIRGEGRAEPGKRPLDGGGGLRRVVVHQPGDALARRIEVRGQSATLDGDDVFDAGG
ncbi:hypothetical protein GPNCGGLF_LOCUS1328 [Methylorubrum aminovorans]